LSFADDLADGRGLRDAARRVFVDALATIATGALQFSPSSSERLRYRSPEKLPSRRSKTSNNDWSAARMIDGW